MNESILIADDDPDVISALRYLLETEGYAVSTAGSPSEVMGALKERIFSVILLDLNYTRDTTSGREGLELITQIRESDPHVAIVVMTAWGSIETAVKAVRAGAGDFVQKPWENQRLLSVVANQIQLLKAEHKASKLIEENSLLRSAMSPTNGFPLTRSPVMQQTMARLEQVAKSDANLLLTGENGTGKNFLVQHIHALSTRRDKPLITVNMGAVTETLFESEMFGHVKGAFTDARETRMGRFELAEGGTLFLDEIGNAPLSQQIKLLRVLEERCFEKVGAVRTQQADCRLICATNCDLDEAVALGAFRKDLLYRINTVVIEVPSLRQRQEDIVDLANYFLEMHRTKYHKPTLEFSEDAVCALLEYSWPGNIRELAHAVERATILARETIDSELLGRRVPRTFGDGAVSMQENLTLTQIERQIIQGRLDQHSGNGLQAAATLGLSKSAFYRHLKKHGL